MTPKEEKKGTVRQLDPVVDYIIREKRRLKNKLRVAKKQIQRKDLPLNENSIIVLPLPPEVSETWILKYFNEFGNIQTHIFRKNYLYMKYEERENVDLLVENEIAMYEWTFDIHQPQKPKGKKINKFTIPQMKTVETRDLFYLKVLEVLEVEKEPKKTFNQQLTKFMISSQPDEKKLAHAKNKIFDDLYKVLENKFPKGKLFPYGSTVVGIAQDDSDLDIFFDGTGSFSGDNKRQSEIDENTDSTAEKTLHEVAAILKKHPAIFEKVFPIPWAKMPIIRFVHVPTKMKCDISFKNGFGVYNSQLLKFCLTLDSRIKPLIIILKKWAKQKNLFGQSKLKNYPLVMLIFFYLQQPAIKLMPTLKKLQNVNKIMFKGWNVNFNDDFPQNSSNCDKTIPDLLRGFFLFYSNFRFGRKVICPLDGTSPKKGIFSKRNNKKNNKIDFCREDGKEAFLQDPIQLDWNVLGTWQLTFIKSFWKACGDTMKKTFVVEDQFILPIIFEPSS